MDGYIVGSMISANSITGEQIQANSIKTANLELSAQQKIQNATDEETVKALIKADLDGFESTLSKEFITVENATTQIQQATEVAVKEATQNIIDNAVSESMSAVDGQLNDKLNQYTGNTLLPAINEKAEEVLQNTENYVVAQLGSYATKQELSNSISQTKEQIELSVSEKYTTKTESTTIITEAIDGITVGAINRVFGTGENKSFKFNGGANETWLPYKFSNDISDKEVYVSFNYTLTGTAQNGSQIEFTPSYLKKANNQTVYRPKHIFFTSNRLQDVNITDTVSFTTEDFQDISPSSTSYIRFVGNGFTGTLSISEVQIKPGNSKTSWSSAPEDVFSNIEDAKNDAISSANNTLITTIENYYTKAETNSQISVAKNEINQSVSSTYATKTDVTSSINGVNSSISSLQTRMDTAESKITDTAITNIVSQNFYTKTETDNQITNKGYQTSSQVQQTVDKLEVKFTESGGYNRILNGCFKKGTKSWTTFGSPVVSVIEDTSCGYSHSLKITTTAQNQGCQQKVDNLVVGRSYVFSSYVYGKSGACGIQVNNGGTYSSALLTKSDTWERLSISFTASTTSATLQLGRGSWGSNGTHYFVAVQLEEGKIVSPYSPHSSEIYDGITTIDKDGIEVDCTNANTKAQMTAEGFKVIRKSDSKELFNASNGDLTMEGTLRTSSSGLRIEASGTDYKIYDGSTMKGFFGFNELGATKYNAPRIYLAVDGVTGSNSHFSLTHYSPVSSPLNTGISYVDFAYYSADLQDYSNIYMSGNSEIKIAPLLGLDIDTHCKLGKYTGKTTTNLAKFLSTQTAENKGWYDGTLRIESVSNKTNPYGLILADNGSNGFAAVSVYADSSGGKHFRPCGDNNTSCGDATYKWSEMYSNNGILQTCDERFKVKRGYSDIEDCYNMVRNIPLYNYVMLEQNKEELSKNRLGKLAMANEDEDGKVHMGIMAQDLRQYSCGRRILVEDEYEKTDSVTDTILHINPLDMTMAVMGALKAEIEKREALEKRLALIEDKLSKLEILLDA